MEGRIDSASICVLVLIAFSLIAARSASLALEVAWPKVKRRSASKEVRMNVRLIIGSALETAWAIGGSVAAGFLPSFP
jgi:hypothetical protein